MTKDSTAAITCSSWISQPECLQGTAELDTVGPLPDYVSCWARTAHHLSHYLRFLNAVALHDHIVHHC